MEHTATKGNIRISFKFSAANADEPVEHGPRAFAVNVTRPPYRKKTPSLLSQGNTHISHIVHTPLKATQRNKFKDSHLNGSHKTAPLRKGLIRENAQIIS